MHYKCRGMQLLVAPDQTNHQPTLYYRHNSYHVVLEYCNVLHLQLQLQMAHWLTDPKHASFRSAAAALKGALADLSCGTITCFMLDCSFLARLIHFLNKEY